MATLHTPSNTSTPWRQLNETFHFDTNQFLAAGDETAVDYGDLFGLLLEEPPVLNANAGYSSVTTSSDSGTASTIPTDGSDPVLPAPQAPPPARSADVKSARDASKRGREATAGGLKNKNQMKELEALAAQKNDEMEQLLKQNSELKFRQSLLEKVVQVRDHQLKVMRGLHEALPQPWGGAVVGTVSGTQQQPQQQQQPAVLGQPTPAAAVCGGGGGGCGGGGGGGGSAAVEVRNTSSSCLMSTPGVNLPVVDRDRFRCMGKGQMIDGWKHFLSEVAVPLLALEANPEDEPAAVVLRQLAAEATFMFKYASLLAPDTVLAAMQTHMESGAQGEPDASHWTTVIRTLDLTPEQVAELRAVCGLFNGIMRGVLAERKALTAHLATGLHGPHADIARAIEQLTVSPECEVLQNLQRSMRREKSAHLLLRGFLFGRTLSTFQFVKVAVYSYPWMPDATALVAAVAEAADV